MIGIVTRTISLATLIRRKSTVAESVWAEALRRNDNRTFRDMIDEEREAVRIILENTEISMDHLTPALKLFLLTPKCSLYHSPFENDNEDISKDPLRRIFKDPFWSIYWPGGQGLTKFIFEEGRHLFDSSKKCESLVLDLGAGCGATAVAAKIVGAEKVIANDINEVACVATAMNAILNNVDIQISRENLLLREPERIYGTVFVGDLLYDEEIAETLIPWLEKTFDNKTRIYVGDPGRHGLNDNLKRRLRLIRRYALPENVKRENIGFDSTTVWQFVPT